MNSLRGFGVAMVTPFLPNGDVDYSNLGKLVNHLILNGVGYFVALGTTSESPTLTEKEKQEILNTIVRVAQDRVPVVVGIGGPSTRNILEQVTAFNLSGVSAILSVTPYYNRPSQSGLIEHYRTIAEHAPLPVILYNVGSRTGCNMEAETALKLAEHDNIIGIKEASGIMNQIMYIVKHKPKDFLVISGDDAIALPLMSVGVDGVISVVGNVFPNEMSQMVRLAQEKKFSEAATIHYKLLDIIQACFKEGSPSGVKAFLSMQNQIEYYLRLPLMQVSIHLQEEIKRLLKTIDSSF